MSTGIGPHTHTHTHTGMLVNIKQIKGFSRHLNCYIQSLDCADAAAARTSSRQMIVKRLSQTQLSPCLTSAGMWLWRPRPTTSLSSQSRPTTPWHLGASPSACRRLARKHTKRNIARYYFFAQTGFAFCFFRGSGPDSPLARRWKVRCCLPWLPWLMTSCGCTIQLIRMPDVKNDVLK